MNNKLIIAVVIALVIGGGAGYELAKVSQSANGGSMGMSETTGIVSTKQQDFKNTMRKLWEDHITWTRLYIVEAISGSKGATDTAARLMQNQVDIGNAIKPYYGDEAGNKLTALLKEHIAGAVDILNAAKAGDDKKLADAHTLWHQNANDIAEFLSTANPKQWPLKDMKDGMNMHLELTMSEAVAELQGKYSDSVKDYDQVHEHILGMADLLSNGIIAQFPDKF